MPRKANPDKAPVVRAVHLKHEDGLACGRELTDKTVTTETLEEVTCKRCLKVANAPKKEVVEGGEKTTKTRKTKGADGQVAKRQPRRAKDFGQAYIRNKYHIEEDPETGKLFTRVAGMPIEVKLV